jgi:hypothetical protein
MQHRRRRVVGGRAAARGGAVSVALAAALRRVEVMSRRQMLREAVLAVELLAALTNRTLVRLQAAPGRRWTSAAEAELRPLPRCAMRLSSLLSSVNPLVSCQVALLYKGPRAATVRAAVWPL